MATTLKSDYEVAIRFKDGGNIEKYVPLEDLNAYISVEETIDITALETLVGDKTTADFGDKSIGDYVYERIRTAQGVEDKLAAIEKRDDSIPETLTGKLLVDPYINDATATRAYYDVGLADTTANVRISALTPGTAGNALEVMVTAASGQTIPPSVTWSSPTLAVVASVDADTNIILTAYELARMLAAETDFTSRFIVTYDDGSLITEDSSNADKTIEATSGAQSLAHGAAGTPLTSTATEIDDTVSAVAAYTPTGADLGTDVGTLWTDVETTTSGLKDRTTALENVANEAAAPMIAKAASQILTIGTKPAEGATVTIGTTAYKFRASALGAGVAASATLTNDETVPADGDTVSIGDGVTTIVYRFKDTMAAKNDVQRGSAGVCVTNLIHAINGTGEAGTNWYTGSDHAGDALLYPFTAVASGDYAIVCTADSIGFAANALTKAASSEHLDWDGTGSVFTGGIDAEAAYDVYDGGSIAASIINLKKAINAEGTAGTHYGTGTAPHPTVEVMNIPGAAGYTSTTLTVTAKTAGTAGNGIATEETLADGSWLAAVTAGGVNGTTGKAGKIRVSGDTLYFSPSDSTTSVSYWRKFTADYASAPVVVNLADGYNYTIPTGLPPSMVIVTETDGSDGFIYLPPATGTGRKVTISVQHATNDISVKPAAAPGTDTINTESALTIPALSTVILLDYAQGKWMTL